MEYGFWLDRAKRFGAALLLSAALVGPDAQADETRSSPALFPDRANACLAAGVPAKGRLSPLSRITSLVIRPQKPDVDGDGSFPPEVKARLGPDAPDAIPLTLIATFSGKEDARFAGRRWGARFACDPDGDGRSFSCTVADWCLDVSFNLHIESKDRVRIDALPDAGSIGELGSPCRDGFRRSLTASSQSRVTYLLNRRPARMCR